MPNDFFKHNDKVYAENLNDGIIVGNSFNFSIDIDLPTDTGGVFPSTTTTSKAKVADVTPSANSNLNIGENVTNNSGSSQDYRLTVYPNFNRFGGFSYISFVGSDCSVKVCEKGENTEIISGLDYDDLSNIAQLKILKEYDIVVSIGNGGVLEGLIFGFLSKEKGISATLNINDVNGLNSRLSTLEATDAQVYNYELSASNYNPIIDDDVTITCKCTDINGNPVANKSLQLYSNNVLVGTKTTNSNGVATWTITLSDWGIIDYSCGGTHIQVNVDGWRTVVGNDSTYKIYRNKTHGRIVLSQWRTTTLSTTWKQFGGQNYASVCPPASIAGGFSTDGVIAFYVNTSGGIYYRAISDTVPSTRNIDAQFEWALKEEIY